MMKIRLTIVTLLLLFSTTIKAQLTVAGGQTATQYVQNNFLGQGVTVSNVNFIGNSAQIGSFNGTNSNIGFTGGIVMGSTAINEITGSANNSIAGLTNVSGNLANPVNADLLSVAQSVTTNPEAIYIEQTNDLAMLEFDFVPQSNNVSFRFVFASDEYLGYVDTEFNDVFGFFVSGPGITGPYSAPAGFPNGSANLALVPNTTTPITISTIYPGLNAQYYVSNAGGTTHAFNGFTVPITVDFNVICGETYHFKFAVADCQDNYLGTAVFLEQGSFTSPPIDLSLSNALGNNIIVESCTDARFMLTRGICDANHDLYINYSMSGTAIYGTDYSIIQASPLFFPSGEDTLYIDFTTVADGLNEGSETITMDIDYTDQFGNPQTGTATFLLNDIQPLGINTNDPTVMCLNDTVLLSAVGQGGSGLYQYTWANGNSTTSTQNYFVTENGVFNFPVTILDECLGSYSDTVKLTVNQTLAIDTMMTFPASACTPDGAVSGTGVGITGTPIYHWEGPNTGGPSQINASVMQNLSPGWYVFTITDNVCSVTDSILLTGDPAPMAVITVGETVGCDPFEVTFNNGSQNATSYQWDFGNSVTNNTTQTSSQNQTYSSDATIRLVAIDGPCSDTAYVSISVVHCGCTDPEAINFDPTAVKDDGSCVIPEPTVIIPNIFTPNGDKDNDLFFLTVTNATDVIIRINNRWGNVVFEGSGLNVAWDGKINGTIAPDGVYFLQYTVKGFKDRELTGQGFIQLIR